MEKRHHFQKYGADSTGSQHAEGCKLIHSYLPIQTKVQVDQGPPHKTRNTETNRRESGEEVGVRGHRGNFPEQNSNSLCSKIKN